jgi:hypothetical protein
MIPELDTLLLRLQRGLEIKSRQTGNRADPGVLVKSSGSGIGSTCQGGELEARGDTDEVCEQRCASPTRSCPLLWPVALSGRVAWRGNLWAVAHAAREVQGTVEWPGAGAWVGCAGEPPKALATAVSAHRIRVSAVSGCSP